jgi:hypothetical protein
MRARTLAMAALVPALLGVATGAAPSGPSKCALDEKSWESLHKLLLPGKGDYRWEEVPWFASLWHARKKAAAENKPILLFGTGGAGFNDPLGNC